MSAHSGWRAAPSRGIPPPTVSTFRPARDPKAMRQAEAGRDPAESIARMASWKGHFDAEMLRAFITSLGIYPNGALVRMASDRLAAVVAQNPQLLAASVVKVFFDTRTQMPVSPSAIDLARITTDKIVGRVPVARWNFAHLDALWAGEDVLSARR